jgi:hypothetical protein
MLPHQLHAIRHLLLDSFITVLLTAHDLPVTTHHQMVGMLSTLKRSRDLHLVLFTT